MRSPREILEEMKQNNLRHKLHSKLSNEVLKNIPGSFEKYYYFIVKKKFIPADFKVPDKYFNLKEKKYFENVYTLRKSNPDLNADFILKFKIADLMDTFSDLFNSIREYLSTPLAKPIS